MPASKAAQAADTACDQRSFSGWMRQVQERMEEALSDALPSSDAIPSRLHEAMRYASLNGGKRIRPLLAFAAGELTGAAADKLAVASPSLTPTMNLRFFGLTLETSLFWLINVG